MSDIVERLHDMDEPLREHERLEIAAEVERLRNHLLHAAGFCEGMAFRIEQHMPLDKTKAAADLREYALNLRKFLRDHQPDERTPTDE